LGLLPHDQLIGGIFQLSGIFSMGGGIFAASWVLWVMATSDEAALL